MPTASGSGTILLPSTIGIKINGNTVSPDVTHNFSEARINHAIGAASRCELRFSDEDFQLVDSDTFKLFASVSISISDGTGTIHNDVFVGSISSIGIEQTMEPLHELVVEAYDKSLSLSNQSIIQTYTKMSYPDIVRKIGGRVGLSTSKVDAFSTQVHDYVLQSCSDAEFLDDIALRTSTEWFVKGSDLVMRQRLTGTPAFIVHHGVELRRFRARFTATGRIDDVTVRGWDPKTQKAIIGTAGAAAAAAPGSSAPGTIADMRKLKESVKKMTTGAIGVTTQDEATAIAKSLANRNSSENLHARGELVGTPNLAANMWITVSDVGNRLSGDYFVTEVEHVIGRSGNLVTKFSAGGVQPARFVDLLGGGGSDRVGHWGTRGLVIGIVTENKDPEKQGRVKVKFPTLGDEDTSDWARLVSPGAGNQRGFQFMPEINDEVLVGFEHGDPRKAYVLGGMWSSKSVPVNDGATDLLDAGKVVQWKLRTQAGHMMEFNDRDKDAAIVFTDVKGKAKFLISDKKIELHANPDTPIELKSGDAVLVLKNGEITMKGKKITIDAQTDMVVNGQDVVLKGKASLKAGAPQVEVKGDASAKVEAGGALTLKGAMTAIN